MTKGGLSPYIGVQKPPLSLSLYTFYLQHIQYLGQVFQICRFRVEHTTIYFSSAYKTPISPSFIFFLISFLNETVSNCLRSKLRLFQKDVPV